MINIENILQKVSTIIETNQQSQQVLLAICQLLKEEVDHYDWVGFYIADGDKQMLTLGPYVGKPTEHTKIAVGKGVCGQVAENKQTMVVQDVSKMDNYIACSIDVQSEIVVPVIKKGLFVAEIDIDSHAFAPFNNDDKILLEQIASKITHLF
jgi:L-methionine (R)-S-oxide reductase